MAWVLTVGMNTVRAEFSTVFPGRDRTSDGSVGDLAHQTGTSGHNPDRTGKAEYKDGDGLDEVRAIDVDRDLVPGSATDWMELVIQYLVRKGRAGEYIPFRYIIYKGRIWSRSDRWQIRVYTGSNKHNQHAHFSGDYTQTADNWRGSLGLASIRGGSATGGMMFCKYGDTGPMVWALQYRLRNLGYAEQLGTADGTYGDRTAAALSALIGDYNGSSSNGRNYGPAEELYVSVLMIRRFAPPGRQGEPGRNGLNGLNGKDGRDGVDGKDGTLTGVLSVQGGQLQVVAVPQEGSSPL